MAYFRPILLTTSFLSSALWSQATSEFEHGSQQMPRSTSLSSKVAGIWPDRFDANMSMATSQPPAAELYVSLLGRLRYDFPSRNQLWEFFDLEGNPDGGELWRDLTTYDYDQDSCYIFNWWVFCVCRPRQLYLMPFLFHRTFSLIAPTWLQAAHYTSTNYLLRQPATRPDGSYTNTPGNYTKADLFKMRNTMGMTNNWLVADSSIAEPIRLEGPDDFDNPESVAILEFSSFEERGEFDESIFDIPDICKNKEASFNGKRLIERVSRGPARLLNAMIPH